MARRGGVKRISAGIYSEIRVALRDRLAMILRTCTIYVEHRNAKTVTTNDVICSLRRFGRPIYGFDPDTYDGQKKARRPETNYDPETARRPETNDGLKKVRRPETNDGLKKARRVGAGTK
ncbi:Histone-fold protein [Ophiocordyceps sinensis CO18]|nr:Histone-fold protein [Ophiocordyceps sinensis CO18]